MIWILLFLVLLFGLIFWLPIRVEIDTEQPNYRVSWQGIFAFWAMPGEQRWRWFFRVFFWQKEWDPSKKEAKKASDSPKKKPSGAKRKSRFSIKMMRALFKNLLGAIKVQQFRINWDTGDFVLNAWLYPAFRMLSCGNRQLYINFLGEQAMVIRLQTRLGLLVLAAMRVFINSKNY